MRMASGRRHLRGLFPDATLPKWDRNDVHSGVRGDVGIGLRPAIRSHLRFCQKAAPKYVKQVRPHVRPQECAVAQAPPRNRAAVARKKTYPAERYTVHNAEIFFASSRGAEASRASSGGGKGLSRARLFDILNAGSRFRGFRWRVVG